MKSNQSRVVVSAWKAIKCSKNDLRLDILLSCGQSFRWKETSDEWTSVLHGKVWRLKQTDDEILYQVLNTEELATIDSRGSTKRKTCTPSNKRLKTTNSGRENYDNAEVGRQQYDDILRDYFQLDVELDGLYKKWSDSDENFRKIASTFKGIRMLRQDPTENLVSFICSSNNNISRISGMVEKLCKTYGRKILELDGQEYHSFPTLTALSDESVEKKLRELGFGYRAAYIQKTAKFITEECPPNWLNSLRSVPYEQAHDSLTKLMGVGSKVADCVCLMSLDKHQAIPVDTHVWQIACRDYNLPSLKKNKYLTDKTYKLIGDFFRDLYGDYAGWAHSVLFSADLKKFKDKKIDEPLQ